MTLIAGCLIYELFSGAKLARTEDLRNTASIPKVSSHDFS
jgi:SCY1-like protein 1